MTSREIRLLFKKYMRVKEASTSHAVLSASGSERWLGCPGSVKLSQGIPSVDNAHGIRGTNTHTLIQFILENSEWLMLLSSDEAQPFKDFIHWDSEMHSVALFAANYVWAEKRRMKKVTGHHPQICVEKKLELEGVGFGTADIILYQPFGLLHVMDYKNGTHVIEPEHNTQGLYYACAAADLFGWNFRELWITIIQPNGASGRGPIRTWKTTPKDLERAGSMLRRGAKATRAPSAPLVTDSKWCWFCPARPICPAQMKGKETKIMQRFTR